MLVTGAPLTVRQAVLSSVRVLRDFEIQGKAPREVDVAPRRDGQRLTFARDRLDGAAGYKLSLDIVDGQLSGGSAQPVIAARGKRPIRVRIRALTGEVPLTPLDGADLLRPAAGKDQRARNALAFLSYREKFLAGSWRFNTYFGRDTLMSLRLLAPVLQPAAAEGGLLSVLARLNAEGEVAHEEDIGEFAVLRSLRDTGRANPAPIYDYGMVDDDFMLAPVMADYLLDRPAGRVRARNVLRQSLGRERVGDALVRNLLWVERQARPFAASPTPANLVAIKPGRATGQWRDSEEGLGRGRFAYDVNAVFVPAALAAIDRLRRSGLLDPYLLPGQAAALNGAGRAHAIWSANAPGLFHVRLDAASARDKIATYAKSIGVPDRQALASLESRPLDYDALALDEAGKPIAVLHSDPGLGFLFGNPSARHVERSLSAMMRPFPAGLMTDVGLLVANPVFSDARTQSVLGKSAYHGTVIWSWQQAVLMAGIERQAARRDLPAALRNQLRQARAKIQSARAASDAVRTSELWSWRFANGRYAVAPFGAGGADEDESNAAQLWSTVFLAF